MTKSKSIRAFHVVAVALMLSAATSPAFAGFGHSSMGFHASSGGAHMSSYGGGHSYHGGHYYHGGGYGYGGGYGGGYAGSYDPDAWGNGPGWGNSAWGAGSPYPYNPGGVQGVQGLNRAYFPSANVAVAPVPHLEVKNYSWTSSGEPAQSNEALNVSAQMLELHAQPASLSDKLMSRR